MSSVEHDHTRLAAYALGVLDREEATAVANHVAGCVECQREVYELTTVRRALDQVPPEAFLNGPPADDLLLRKTLRRARGESSSPVVPVAPQRRRWSPVVAISAAAAVAVALAGGVLIGRQTAPGSEVASPPTSVPANARTAQVTDPTTGATMDVTVIPKAGWVWVSAKVGGVPAGARCELLVVSRDGEQQLAGSWLVSEKGASEGTALEGTALVDPNDVTAVEVATTDGRTMVTVPL